jgi:hypothetical protein
VFTSTPFGVFVKLIARYASRSSSPQTPPTNQNRNTQVLWVCRVFFAIPRPISLSLLVSLVVAAGREGGRAGGGPARGARAVSRTDPLIACRHLLKKRSSLHKKGLRSAGGPKLLKWGASPGEGQIC